MRGPSPRQQWLHEIIAACGGLGAVGRLTGVSRQAVFKWVRLGEIRSARMAILVADAARRHGRKVTVGQLAGVEAVPELTPPSGTDDGQTGGGRKGNLRIVRQSPETTRAAAEAQYDSTPRRLYPNPNKKRGNNWPMSPVELRPAA